MIDGTDIDARPGGLGGLGPRLRCRHAHRRQTRYRYLSADPARTAATVLVLRDAPDLQVLMLRRHARAGFAASAWVFPGGVVDPADARLAADRWRGIDPPSLADRFSAPPDAVLAFHVAAVRETFEEAGLLFAFDAEGLPVAADPADADARALRAGLAERSLGADDFAWFLQRRGWVLDLGALTYSARWVTPLAEPRRYDTAFFLAADLAGQVAASDLVETTDQCWIAPAAALAGLADGTFPMIFPTVRTLEALAGQTTSAGAVAAARAQPAIPSVLPHMWVDADGRFTRLSHPDDADYPAALYDVDA